MRSRLAFVVGFVVSGFALALSLAIAAPEVQAASLPAVTAAASSAAQFAAEAQSAPGREVLRMGPQEFAPDMLALANGNVVVAGAVADGHVAIAELLPDGRLDPAFGEHGVEITAIKLLPWQILALPDGALLVLGPSRSPGEEEPVITHYPDWQMLRLRSDGTPDPTFGREGLLDVAGAPVPSSAASQQLAPQLAPNGAVVLPTFTGALFSSARTSLLVRLNADGTRDASFGSAGLVQLPATLAAFSVSSDGSVVVVMGQGSGSLLMRLTANGSPEASFNGGSPLQLPLYGTPDSMLVEPDGSIVLHGYPSSDELAGGELWRYAADGALDTAWGTAGVVDLRPGYGAFNQLFPAPGGQTLLVTTVTTMPYGVSPARVRIRRITASGQLDPSLGGAAGLWVTLPFGGGSYAPGTIANLHQDSFEPFGVIQDAEGGLLFNGQVWAEEAIPTDAGPELVAGIGGSGIAALDSSFKLDPTFDGATRARVGVRVTSTRLSSSGIAVRLSSSDAALSVVTITAGGQTIARGTVRFFASGNVPFFTARTLTRRTVRIPLTRAGQRLRRRHRPFVKLAVSVSAVDLAAGRASSHASARLAG
jgi:uncharacterized delta-60 repeat protein